MKPMRPSAHDDELLPPGADAIGAHQPAKDRLHGWSLAHDYFRFLAGTDRDKVLPCSMASASNRGT
jgi:hypothetical protein